MTPLCRRPLHAAVLNATVIAIVLVVPQGCGSSDTASGFQELTYVAAQLAAQLPTTSTKAISWSLSPQDDLYQCDLCVNCVDNCGHSCCAPPPPPPSNSCGQPGTCPCTKGDYFLIGYCASRPPSSVCTYCPPGTRLLDPCGTECQVVNPQQAPQPQTTHCPSRFPVSCGDGTCCPSAHGACCGSLVCGASASDCDDKPWYAQNPSRSSSSSGSNTPTGGGGGSGGNCADFANHCPSGLVRASLRAGCCAAGTTCLSSCADGCSNGWYEAKGQLFGPCSPQDQGCLQRAAQAAISACGGH